MSIEKKKMRRKSLSAITFSLLISLPAGCASTVPDDAPHIVVNVENGQAYGDHELLMNLLKDKAEKADIKMEFLETGHNGEDAETSLDKGADALLILADDWDESCETMAKAAIDHKIPLVCLIDSVVYDNEALRDTLQEQARCWDENGDMVSVIFSTSVSGIEQACAFLIQQGLDAADLNHDHVISLGVSEWTSGPFLSIPEKRFSSDNHIIRISKIK